MTKYERCKKAMDDHATSLNCCQSVLCAFSDVIGMSDTECCALGSCFGGGLRYGGVCGTVSAAAMILGILYPHTPENGMEGKLRSTELILDFERRFTECFDALDCRDLKDREDVQGTGAVEALDVAATCDRLIVSAVELLYDMLEELKKE